MMLKTIIYCSILIVVGVVVASPSHAGPYCDALGYDPSISKAETVMRQVILNAVQSGTDVDELATDVATDIIENCPQNESIILQALDNLERTGV